MREDHSLNIVLVGKATAPYLAAVDLLSKILTALLAFVEHLSASQNIAGSSLPQLCKEHRLRDDEVTGCRVQMSPLHLW